MTVENGAAASTALISWYNDIPNQIPNYTGKLYIIPYQDEHWVVWPKGIYNKTITPNYAWGNIPTQYRVKWSTLPATIDKFVCLAFVDETHPDYHTGNPVNYPSGEPTSIYKSNYNTFIGFYNNMISSGKFFKGVCYPIIASTSGKAFLLHAIASMYGRTLTQEELNNIYDVPSTNANWTNTSPLLTKNPYTSTALNKTPSGLINYNWKGVWNKTSPASAVFSSNTFAQELNNLLS